MVVLESRIHGLEETTPIRGLATSFQDDLVAEKGIAGC
jgi:hypothetical protein